MSAIAPANVSQSLTINDVLPDELKVKILTENFTFEELKVLRGVCHDWNAQILDRMNQLWQTVIETFPYIECRSTIEDFSSDQLFLLRDVAQMWHSQIVNEKRDEGSGSSSSESKREVMPSPATMCRLAKLLKGYEGDDFSVNFIHLAKRIAEVEKESTVALFKSSFPLHLGDDLSVVDEKYSLIMAYDCSKHKNAVSTGNIKNISNALYKWKNLEIFSAFGNRFTKLPSFFFALKNLRRLNLSKNRLLALPLQMGQLANLTYLDVSANQLTDLPRSIVELKNLKNLKISSNQFKALPEVLGNLTQLEEIWAGNNQIESIPQSLGRLVNLRYLSFHSNQLTSLPDFFVNLVNLQQLSISENGISELPTTLIALKEKGNLTLITQSYSDGNSSTVRLSVGGAVEHHSEGRRGQREHRRTSFRGDRF